MRIVTYCVTIAALFGLAGCAAFNASKFAPTVPSAPINQAHSVQNEGSYVSLEYPISLPPVIASGLNLDESKLNLGYSRNLLGLPSSASKMQTRQVKGEASVGSGIANASGSKQRYRTTYDTIVYASYPLQIEVPYDQPPGCLYKDKSKCSIGSINILPLIGAGVRVIADYDSTNISGDVALAYLSAKASGSELNGSLQLQLLGVSRFGSTAAGFSQLNLTPESINMMQQQVSGIMSQLWYKDTVIQPQIVGYSILGGPDPKLLSTPDIMDQLLANVHHLAHDFFETLLAESIRRGDVKAEDGDKLRSNFETRLAQSRLYSKHTPVTDLISARVDAALNIPKTRVEDAAQRMAILNTVLAAYLDKRPDNLDTAEVDRLMTHEIVAELINNLLEAALKNPKQMDPKKKDAIKSAVQAAYKDKKLAEISSADLAKSIQAEIAKLEPENGKQEQEATRGKPQGA